MTKWIIYVVKTLKSNSIEMLATSLAVLQLCGSWADPNVEEMATSHFLVAYFTQCVMCHYNLY